MILGMGGNHKSFIIYGGNTSNMYKSQMFCTKSGSCMLQKPSLAELNNNKNYNETTGEHILETLEN